MPEPKCPVTATINKLDELVKSGELKDPKSRRRAEDMLALMRDIAWGSASLEHIQAVKMLSREIIEDGSTAACVETGNMDGGERLPRERVSCTRLDISGEEAAPRY